MSDALQIIRLEHQNLAAVLHCLRFLVREIDERGIEPPFDAFEAIIDYVESFQDAYHHPKEDAHLFARLRARDPGAAALLDALQAEHRRGPILLGELRGALAALRAEGAAALPRFRAAVAAYADFQHAHMAREEREVLPRTRARLTPADWAELDRIFSENRDPLFGAHQKARFRALYSLVVERTPQPFGYAEPAAGRRGERE